MTVTSNPQVARENKVFKNKFRNPKLRTHPLDSLDSDLPSDVKRAAQWVLDNRLKDVPAQRELRFSEIQKVSSLLEVWSSHLLCLSPQHIKVCSLPKPHVALIDAICHAIEWPDTLLTEQLILGAPAVGDIPDSGIFRKEDVPSSQTLESLDNCEWNAKLMASIEAEARRPDKATVLARLWEKTQAEVEKGIAFPI